MPRKEESTMPEMPNYDIKPIQINTGPAQIQLQKQQQEAAQKQQGLDNILRTTQMASQLAQSFVELSKQRQQRDALRAYALFNPNKEVPVLTNPGGEQTASPLYPTQFGPVGTPGEPAPPTYKNVPLGQTPEGQATQKRLLANVLATNPDKAAETVIASAFPKAPTSLEALAAQAISKGQPVNPVITETAQALKTPKGIQHVDALLDGQPAKVAFDPNKKIYVDPATGEDISARVKPIPPATSGLATVRTEALKNKLTEDMGKDLNELAIGSNSPAGISAKRQLFAKSGLALIKQAEQQEGGADKRQMAELQMEVARVLTGNGVISNEQLNSLATTTARSKVANWQEWLTNKPTGLEQQAFMQRFKETLNRQLDFHTSELDKYQKKTMAKYTTFQKTYPPEFKASLQQAGFDPDKFAKTGKLEPVGDQMPEEFKALAAKPQTAHTWTSDKEARYQALKAKLGK